MSLNRLIKKTVGELDRFLLLHRLRCMLAAYLGVNS